MREQFELYILGEKKTKMLILFVFIWSLILFLDLFIFDYSLLLILMNILFIDILIKCNKNNYWIIRQDSIEIICIENILTFIKFIFFQKKVIVLFKDMSKKGFFHNLCFIFSTCNNQNLLCLHYCLDSHCVCLSWNIFC